MLAADAGRRCEVVTTAAVTVSTLQGRAASSPCGRGCERVKARAGGGSAVGGQRGGGGKGRGAARGTGRGRGWDGEMEEGWGWGGRRERPPGLASWSCWPWAAGQRAGGAVTALPGERPWPLAAQRPDKALITERKQQQIQTFPPAGQRAARATVGTERRQGQLRSRCGGHAMGVQGDWGPGWVWGPW